MQFYDIIMLAVLLAAIGFGAIKGLAWQVASMAAIFLSYFVAIQLKQPVSAYLDLKEDWEGIGVMLGLYLASSLVIWVVFGFIRKIIDRVKLRDFDRHAGAVLGAVKGVIVGMIITLFAVSLLSDEQKKSVCGSYSGYLITKIIDRAEAALPAEVHAQLHGYLEKLDRELSHDHPEHPPHSHAADSVENTDLDEAARTAKKLLDAGSQILDGQR